MLFAILQKYEFSSKSQPCCCLSEDLFCCLRYCKSTSFQANHNYSCKAYGWGVRCLRYCKSTSFQANHNSQLWHQYDQFVVCDTAKVRVFKQITTDDELINLLPSCLRYCKSTSFQANHNRDLKKEMRSGLFAILQKYEFSSKSQQSK